MLCLKDRALKTKMNSPYSKLDIFSVTIQVRLEGKTISGKTIHPIR